MKVFFLLKLFLIESFSVSRKFWSLTAFKNNTCMTWGELKTWEIFNLLQLVVCLSEVIELNISSFCSKIKARALSFIFIDKVLTNRPNAYASFNFSSGDHNTYCHLILYNFLFTNPESKDLLSHLKGKREFETYRNGLEHYASLVEILKYVFTI